MKKIMIAPLIIVTMISGALWATGQPETQAPAQQEAARWVPKDDVTVIVPYGAGGSSDLLARTFANEGASKFATPLVIKNVPGGGCAIGFTELINAKPDGLTIGNTNSSVVVNTLTGTTPYVYYKELKPLVQIGYAPYIVYVRANSDIKNLDDLKNAILSREVVMAANNRGGQTHWELEYFALRNGGDITSIIYDGGASSIAALLGGHAEITVQAPSDGQEYVKSGLLRAIAILDPQRLENDYYRHVPTSEEQGYGWLTNGFFHGYSAPKGVSAEVVKYYEEAFKATLDIPKVREAIEYYGFTIRYLDSEGFGKVWTDSAEMYKKTFAELGDRLK